MLPEPHKEEPDMARFKKLMITGAAGDLGRQLRRGLAHLADTLLLTDREEMDPPAAHEQTVLCDLADLDAVCKMMEGVDAVAHFGAASRENTFEYVLASSIRGGYNVYEGARRNGIRRVVYASSIHAVGYYPREHVIDAKVPHRPDSIYGLSKCFVEDLASYYHDKFGIESVCLRINSCFPQPADRRMLATWLSFADLVRLVEQALVVPRTGFTVAYGISDNKEMPVSNRHATHLGFVPEDSSEPFRAEVEAKVPPGDPHDPAVKYVGGSFCAAGHFEDE